PPRPNALSLLRLLCLAFASAATSGTRVLAFESTRKSPTRGHRHPERRGDRRSGRGPRPNASLNGASVACVALRAPVALQDLLARADGVRSDLDQLVLIDPLHGRLDREQLGRRDDDVLVATRGADVGE